HPFFNQSVRQSLGLSNWQQKKAYSFYRFQQLLFAASDILITWQAEKDGEWIQASPWVSSLQNFAQTAFASSLKDTELEQLLQQTGPLTQRNSEQLENIQTVQQARPQLNAELLPTDYSASRQQRLIDCPYKFFAADGLRLKPLEEISQELLKSEYGEKVHLILEAFHQQKPGLPEPFTQALTLHNKAQALAHLNDLSRFVFNRQTEDNVQHRGWLERWLKTTEAYIDWQIQRQVEWQIHKLEQKLAVELSNGISLSGRLDRVDENQNGYSIIDYKTGNTAKQQDIELAENIQLTSYAMLLPQVNNTLYLKLDNGKVSVAGSLEQDQLQQLTEDITQRLGNNIEQIRQGAALPAWGDAGSCAYCDMAGLCRKQIWESSSA
ncbi:MAG: PD-(D/E)XK nuclease family protein, partial [Pseudomonadales bacterium]|nr:PD-(D/E)XK nuclease family protein [Pseudomonadales bacterium]